MFLNKTQEIDIISHHIPYDKARVFIPPFSPPPKSTYVDKNKGETNKKGEIGGVNEDYDRDLVYFIGAFIYP